jgi:hypothetical protein
VHAAGDVLYTGRSVADEDRIQSYAEFWPYYLGEHRDPTCRALHYFGSTMAISSAVSAAVFGNPWLVLLGFVLGYGPAWIGHFFIEHNRPATFKYPLWSLGSDFKMLAYFVTGRMGAEMERLYGSRAPAKDAPLRTPT